MYVKEVYYSKTGVELGKDSYSTEKSAQEIFRGYRRRHGRCIQRQFLGATLTGWTFSEGGPGHEVETKVVILPD